MISQINKTHSRFVKLMSSTLKEARLQVPEESAQMI